MKTIYLLLILCIGLSLNSAAQALSKDAEISILTCSPGSELYSLFGHTAIRVHDAEKNMDLVFNYGTFDFRTEHFYLKYAQGLLPYQLSVTSYSNFIMAYIMDKRSVYSQTLLLDSIQREKLFDLLVENQKPENRTYLYNFLYDNCSTRIRDIIAKSETDSIQWNIPDADKSFWNLLDEYLYRMPWVKWGIHTILAQPGSCKALPYQYMFLPDYLMEGIDKATVQGVKIAAPIETLNQATEESATSLFSPLLVFSFCSLLLILLCQYVFSFRATKGIAFGLFLISGLIGLLLVFLGGFTQHPITAPNLNMIWANPLNFIAAFFFLKKKLSPLVSRYLLFYSVILIIGIPVWFIALPAVPLASLGILILMLYISLKIKYTK